METKTVEITLRGQQTLDGETIPTRQHLTGTLEQDGDGWLLRYQEESDSAAIDTTLLLREREITLERSGGIRTRMHFRPGEECPAVYRTAWGNLDLTVAADYTGYTMSADGGRVMLRYRLLSGGQSIGDYTLKLQIRAVKS